MKKLLLFLMSPLFLFTACNDRQTETVVYHVNEPVFISVTEFRNTIRVTKTEVPIQTKGKICFYQDYLFISEIDKGIHVIDNRNPSQPKHVAYIELMGNKDLAVRDNILYADAYMDLVWFDITDPANPQLLDHLGNVFLNAYPEAENEHWCDLSLCHEEGKVVVGWKTVDREQVIDYSDQKGWLFYQYGGSESVNSLGDSSSGGSYGVTGSMAKFSLYKDYLYTISDSRMSIFDVSAGTPQPKVEQLYIGNGWEIETIFSYKDCMFMGTPNGLLIYSVTDPVTPQYRSSFQHIYGCDPVVVENDLAYVTVRSGNACGQNIDELFVVDVSDVDNPRQLVSYTMTNPKGLGIDDGLLFVCDDGLKIYKADNPRTIMANQLQHYEGMDGFDVIPFNNVLMMIAEDGLYQYDYTDPNAIKELSKLPVGK